MQTFTAAMAFFMLGSGLFLTVRLGFFQFTHIKSALKAPFERGGAGGGVSPFAAMATALGSSIGTANIAGVAGALMIGGPGAVFWMWVAGLLGMASKLSEILLGVAYRDTERKIPRGGPMYYIERGLGRRFRPLAVAFSLFGMLAGLMGTALVQSNTIAQAALFCFPSAAARPAAGLLTALLTGAVVVGGAARIGRFSEKAVPLMAVFYAAAALAVIISGRERLPSALSSIFRGAFGIRQAAGGFWGALCTGVARGVYSNEAGVGSGAIAHSGTSETDPVKQGLLGVFEVFADTLVTCTLTALAVLTSGVLTPTAPSGVSGTELACMAFAPRFGSAGAGLIISLSLLLFAFTSLVGWELYYERCAEYVFGSKPLPALRLLFLACIPLGAVTEAGLAWKLGELMNYLMALPNMLALLLLSGKAARLVREYKSFESKPARGSRKK